ncbi:RNA recognition domain-containing protein [Coniochaeta sp. 2T2.1]|nr:RNA recognition domain-containing protein [Coniochaeta sp. 2T2.1]
MAPQDSFIEEDDETCPLCIEELDIQDRNFHPCPCGYQVCQFCFNNIKNNMNGLCPACRRPYDEKTIQWKVVTQEEIAEFRAKIQNNQKRRAAEQRQKEVQKREAEKDNRKNLVGVRVVQKNLVYVTGLTPTVREDELLKTLRRPEYFGQYGNIQKISISNRKSTDGQPQSLGIYVTFERKEDAARCIQAVNGSQNSDRVLRAQLGTTKYCSAWLRHETCSNRQCMFLHELGDEEDSYTRQDLSSMNSINTQRPLPSGASSSSRSASRQQSHPTPSQSSAPQMARSSSRDGSENGAGSALPSSANWAQNPQVRSRRGSHATSGAASSPAISHSLPATAEAPQEAIEEHPAEESPVETSSNDFSSFATAALQENSRFIAYNDRVYQLIKAICEGSPYLESASDVEYPSYYDSRGWEKRRAMREEEEARMLEAEPEEPEPVQDVSDGEPESSGSHALGGEPEDREPPRETYDFERRGSTQPAIRSPADGLFGPALGSGFSQAASNIGSIAGSRAITPQQQAYLRAQAAFTDHLPPGITPAQSSLFQNPGHNRQGSRFSFANANDNQSQSTAIKLAANPRIMAQQTAMMPSAFPSQIPSQPGNQFYPSTMPGPPPGLKSTGTPPNLFGHGFGGSGFGGGQKDVNELLQNITRGRGTGGQAHDAGKREYMSSIYPNQYPPSTSSTPAPASGLMASLYPGAFPDYGKQKKKGKKHRHANTSSSGGSGLVDLVDPSILQASRMQQHQQQSNAGVAPGLFGGQSQGGYNPNMMYGNASQYGGGRWA